MNFSEMKETLAKRLSVKRFEHSLGVCEMARRLALNFEIDLDKAMIENSQFMKAGEEVTIILKDSDESPLSAEIPPTVYLEVIEADPGVKGNTATNALKNSIVETGARVMVPLFIEAGDKIKVNTEDGSYLERVK